MTKRLIQHGKCFDVDDNDENIIKDLITILETDDDPLERMAAAENLGEMGNQIAVAPLINALNDRRELSRWGAAEALGQLGNPKAIPPLLKALGDTSSHVRENAAIALGMIGDDKVINHLSLAIDQEDAYPNAVKERNEAVKKAAHEAIEKIRTRRVDITQQ